MKQEDTKVRLYVSAKNLFYEKGFHGVTLKDISEAADANPALIAYYFGNKTELGREILEKYFSRLKKLTVKGLKSAAPEAEVYLQTAVYTRVMAKMFALYPNLLQFYLELNESFFYTESDLLTAGFFEELNLAYGFGYDRNFLRIGAITNYAVGNALATARANGIMHCSDAYIILSVIRHQGTIFGFSKEKTDEVIEASKPLAEKIQLRMDEGFRLTFI